MPIVGHRLAFRRSLQAAGDREAELNSSQVIPEVDERQGGAENWGRRYQTRQHEQDREYNEFLERLMDKQEGCLESGETYCRRVAFSLFSIAWIVFPEETIVSRCESTFTA